jgi:hypothetical protein
MNNQKQIIDFLLYNPLKTEREIQISVWGYDRKRVFESNKKYADLLRRALRKKSIDRVKLKIKNKKEHWYYFIPS